MKKVEVQRYAWVLILTIWGCGTDATKVAEDCVESDLIAQCPPGTTPRLDADATSSCGGSANADILNEEGAVAGRCAGTGTCRVVCELSIPCENVVSWSTENGVVCDDPQGACGNLICDSGELETCPDDCSGECGQGESRCNGDVLETCGPRNDWQPIQTCADQDQVCRDPGGIGQGASARCVDRQGGAGGAGGQGGEGGAGGAGGQGGEGGTGGAGGQGGAGGGAGGLAATAVLVAKAAQVAKAVLVAKVAPAVCKPNV